jgi:hypothetical protein
MLGFNPVQLGLTGKTQDFADLILVTPNGHAAIVECTTGLLRADNKLPKLLARHGFESAVARHQACLLAGIRSDKWSSQLTVKARAQ